MNKQPDKTSRGYDVFGPDLDDEVAVGFDRDDTEGIILLTRKDVERILARWDKSHAPDCAVATNARHACSCGADKQDSQRG